MAKMTLKSKSQRLTETVLDLRSMAQRGLCAISSDLDTEAMVWHYRQVERTNRRLLDACDTVLKVARDQPLQSSAAGALDQLLRALLQLHNSWGDLWYEALATAHLRTPELRKSGGATTQFLALPEIGQGLEKYIALRRRGLTEKRAKAALVKLGYKRTTVHGWVKKLPEYARLLDLDISDLEESGRNSSSLSE